LIPPKEGILRYFRLCEFVAILSLEARNIFAEERRKHYLELETRLRKAAEYWNYDFPN